MENLYFGVEVMVVGFLIVMIALLTLAFILVLFEKLLAPKKKKETAAALKTSHPATSSPGESKGLDEQGEVVAAIAASLSLFLEKPFRIHRIAPAGGGEQSRWILANRTRSVQLSKELVFYRRRRNL